MIREPFHQVATASRAELTRFGYGGHRSVTVSPDGQHMAVITWTGLLMYDVADWHEPLWFLHAPTEWWVRQVAFTPDGQYVAGALYPQGPLGDQELATIVLWNAGDGAEVARWDLYAPVVSHLLGYDQVEGEILTLAFSPDGTRLAVLQTPDVVNVWDVATQTRVARLEPPLPEHLETLDTREEEYELLAFALREPSEAGRGIAWSPDGTQLAQVTACTNICPQGLMWEQLEQATACRDICPQVLVWDIESAATPRLALSGFQRGAVGVAYSADGKRLAGVGFGEDVLIWNAATGRKLGQVVEYTRIGRRALVWSHEGRTLFVSRNGGIEAWNIRSGKHSRLLLELPDNLFGYNPSWAEGLGMSADGRHLYAATRTQLVELDAADGAVERILQGFGDPKKVAFIPGANDRLAIVVEDTVTVWSLTERELLWWSSAFDSGYSVSASTDGTRLAASGKAVQMWDAATGETLYTVTPESQVWHVRFAPGGGVAALESYTQTFMLDAVQGVIETVLPVSAVAWSPDGGQMIAGTAAGAVELRDGNDFTLVSALAEEQEPVAQVMWSPDGAQVWVRFRSGHATLWDALTWSIVGTKEIPSPIPYRSVETAPDWSYYVTTLSADGFSDQQVAIGGMGSMQPECILGEHLSDILDIAVSPDSRTVATADGNEVILWDVAACLP